MNWPQPTWHCVALRGTGTARCAPGAIVYCLVFRRSPRLPNLEIWMNTQSPLVTPNSLQILSVNFNQEQDCFAFSHDHGFLVYNTNPIDLRVKRVFTTSNERQGTGIGQVAMLHRTNYLALVGGGKSPRFPNNKLVIWDDLKRKSSLTLDFMSPVLNVLLSRTRIVVILANQVLVYGFLSPPKKFSSYDTIDNELGLGDLSVNGSSYRNTNDSSTSSMASSISSSHGSLTKENTRYQTLAIPGRQVGQLQIIDISPNGQDKNLLSIVKAHKSRLRCIALNRSGSMVASASETGTIIRIHSTHNTALLYEFRRGLDQAIILSMKFSPDDAHLAVLSDKNTLHIFKLLSYKSNDNGNDASETEPKPQSNRKHMLNKVSIPIFKSYFNSTWSFCSVNTNQYHGEYDNNMNDEGTLGWLGNDSIIIIWKIKQIWEKYVILGKPEHEKSSWELVRSSWKSLDTRD